MKERLAKLNMSLPEAHVPSGTERLATAEELAEIGGTPSDPLTETQILALLEIQMKDDLQKAAEESAAQAKAAALHELEAALNPKPADGAEKSFHLETVKPAAQPASLFPSEKISPLHQRVLGSAQPPTHATPLPWPALRSPPPPSASRLSSGFPATQESAFPSGDPTEFRRSRQAPRLSPAAPFLTVRGLRVNSY